MAINLNTLDKLNPLAILKKGYSQVLKDNKNVSSITELRLDDDIDLRLVDGQAKARILEIKEQKMTFEEKLKRVDEICNLMDVLTNQTLGIGSSQLKHLTMYTNIKPQCTF